MRKTMKLALLTVAVAIVSAFAVSSASAIEVDPAGRITASNTELILLSEGGFINPELTCGVTINGTLPSSITDSNGSHAGTSTDVDVANCSGGEAEATNVGNWPIVYNSKELASSPKLANLTQNSVSFTISVAGVDCNYGGATRFELSAEGSPLVARTLLVDPSLTLDSRTGSDLFCPPNGGLEGFFNINSQTLVLP